MKKRGNGSGGIIDRGKGRYLRYSIRITTGYDKDGKQQFKYLSSHHTKKEAELELAKYIVNPYDLIARKMTFAEVFDLAFAEYLKKNTAKQTIASYKAAFKNCSSIANMPIADIKKIHLQNCLDIQEKRSKSNLNNIVIVINLVFNYALENDLINKDYSQFIEVRNVISTKKRNIFTEDEIQELWNNVNDDKVKITLILLYTGFRINELLTLIPSQVNLTEGHIKGGLKTKAGKDRIVPIHHRIKPLLEYFLKRQNKTVFETNYQNYNYWLSKINHKPHDTRHTFTTLLQKYGAKKVWIDKIVGHTSGNLTDDLYTHADFNELKKTVELLP